MRYRTLATIFLGAAILPIMAVSATRIDFKNQRYARCLADNMDGSIEMGGFVIKNQAGQTVIVDPVLRTYGTELLGRRKGGVVAANYNEPYSLSFAFKKQESSYVGEWDYVRIGGFVTPLFTETYGRGEIIVSSPQYQIGQMMTVCANTPWVNRPKHYTAK